MKADLTRDAAPLTSAEGFRTTHSWRPTALVRGGGTVVFAAGYPGYGRSDGYLVRWDTATGGTTQHADPVPGYSVVALARSGDTLAMGTSVRLGQGVKITGTGGLVAVWDAAAGAVKRTYRVAEGQVAVDNLAYTASGLVLGAARNEVGKPGLAQVFTLDTESGRVTRLRNTEAGELLYGTLVPGPDGAFWAVAQNGVVRIDLENGRVSLAERAVDKVTAAGAYVRGALVYACGPLVFRYVVPVGSP
jgi:hypothetical protein